MIKILFVCHGNICRSPMAEFIMKDLVKRNGVQENFEIRSAATSTEEIGNLVYPPAKAVFAEHGISCKGKTAIRITKDDLNYYDYIIAMDSNNLRNLSRMFGTESLKNVSLMMDYTSCPGDVADPWYTGNFDVTYRDILDGCTGLLRKLLHKSDD